MAAESYSLIEVAEMLGVSKRTLQRQIREGAFPGRFLAPSAHGMEMRIPAAEVIAAKQGGGEAEGPPIEVEVERRLARFEGGSETSAASWPNEGEVTPEVFRSLVREERAVFLAELRTILQEDSLVRAEEVEKLRGSMERMATELARVRESLADTPRAGRDEFRWTDTLGKGRNDLDVDGLLSDLNELEAMLGLGGDN